MLFTRAKKRKNMAETNFPQNPEAAPSTEGVVVITKKEAEPKQTSFLKGFLKEMLDDLLERQEFVTGAAPIIDVNESIQLVEVRRTPEGLKPFLGAESEEESITVPAKNVEYLLRSLKKGPDAYDEYRWTVSSGGLEDLAAAVRNKQGKGR